jgi:hypothetical protein
MLWRTLVLLSAIAGLRLTSRAEMNDGVHIPKYDFSITFMPVESAIQVEVLISVAGASGDSSLALLFAPRARIESIAWSADSAAKQAEFRLAAPESLVVTIPPEVRSDSLAGLKLTYLYPIESPDSSLILLDRGHRWYPLIASNIAQCRVEVQVPSGWFAVTGGDLVSADSVNDSVHTVFQSRIPMFKIMLGIGRSDQFVTATETAGPTTLQVIGRPQDSAAARTILKEAVRAFSYFSEKLGPYHHSRLTFIETQMFPGANLGTSIIALGSDMLAPLDRGSAGMLDLAIASQWFGAGVFGKFQEDGFWFVTLSMPHFERLMYLRETLGEETFRKDLEHGVERYRQFAGTQKDQSILSVDYLNTQEKGNIVAFKGPYILERVHEKIGEEGWRQFAAGLYQTRIGTVLTIPELLSELMQLDPQAGSWLLEELSGIGMPAE